MMRTPPLSAGQRVYLLDLLKKYLPPAQHKKLPDAYSNIRKTPLSAVYDGRRDNHQSLLRPLFFSTLRQDGLVSAIAPTKPRELVKIILSDWLSGRDEEGQAGNQERVRAARGRMGVANEKPKQTKYTKDLLKRLKQSNASKQSEMFNIIRSE